MREPWPGGRRARRAHVRGGHCGTRWATARVDPRRPPLLCPRPKVPRTAAQRAWRCDGPRGGRKGQPPQEGGGWTPNDMPDLEAAAPLATAAGLWQRPAPSGRSHGKKGANTPLGTRRGCRGTRPGHQSMIRCCVHLRRVSPARLPWATRCMRKGGQWGPAPGAGGALHVLYVRLGGKWGGSGGEGVTGVGACGDGVATALREYVLHRMERSGE